MYLLYICTCLPWFLAKPDYLGNETCPVPETFRHQVCTLLHKNQGGLYFFFLSVLQHLSFTTFKSHQLYNICYKFCRIGCLHCSFETDDTSDLMSHEKACFSSINQRAIMSKQVTRKACKPKQV